MENYIDVERITRLSAGDESVPMYQKIIKLGEENGEVAEAFEIYDLVPVSMNAEEVIEECCDVINVSVDIINAANNMKDDIYVIDTSDKALIGNANREHLYQYINLLNSECGKVSQSFLRLDGAKNVSKSASNGIQDLIEQTYKVIQAAHVIICVVELAEDDLSMEFVQNMFTKKLDKWESKQKAY